MIKRLLLSQIAIAISSIIHGLLLYRLWSWLVTPFTHITINIIFAITILLIKDYLFIDTIKILNTDYSEWDFEMYFKYYFLSWILVPAQFLLCGYVLHLFI